MRFGIIGSGHIGATTARLFIQAGHEVAIANSRGPESLRDLESELGPRCHPMTVDEAAKYGEIVLLAVPWRTPEALPRPETVQGKIVIDAMNPYTEDGQVMDLHGGNSSEEVAKRLPGARIVKAFNTMYYQQLATEGRPDLPMGQRRALFVAGSDTDAKQTVAKLIEQIGFTPVDTGTLHDGGLRQQPGTDIYNRNLTAQEAGAILGTQTI